MVDWKDAGKQMAVGAVFGGVGGSMDAVYSEPIGAVLAASLASMQALDHAGALKLPWNDFNRDYGFGRRVGNGNDDFGTRAAASVLNFGDKNILVATGFLAGYVIGGIIADEVRIRL